MKVKRIPYERHVFVSTTRSKKRLSQSKLIKSNKNK